MATKLSFIVDIVKRMQNPLHIKAFAINPENDNPDPIFPGMSSWDDTSLSQGYPSLLLLFSCLEQEDLIDDGVSHQFVLKIKEALEKRVSRSCSIFSGLAGLCFSLQIASRQGKRYQRMVDTLNEIFVKRTVEDYLTPLHHTLKEGMPVPSQYYDTIQGICGIGRYALENLSHPQLLELTQNIAKVLVLMVRPIKINGVLVPGWYLSSDDYLNGRNKQDKGNFNLGLSHGVTGILAYLAIASLKGVVVEGQQEAMQFIVDWIYSVSFLKDGVINWSTSVSFQEQIEGKIVPRHSRDAWCYGAPGVCRTLYLTGKALENEELKIFASGAFRGVFKRAREEWNIPGPTLCHGIAGLLLIAHLMSQEEGCDDLQTRVEELNKMLLSYYDPEVPFGFQDIEPCKQGGTANVSKVGLLEGVSGVLLTLLTINSTTTPKWYLPFLIHA